jgi:hypothetical protein
MKLNITITQVTGQTIGQNVQNADNNETRVNTINLERDIQRENTRTTNTQPERQSKEELERMRLLAKIDHCIQNDKFN